MKAWRGPILAGVLLWVFIVGVGALPTAPEIRAAMAADATSTVESTSSVTTPSVETTARPKPRPLKPWQRRPWSKRYVTRSDVRVEADYAARYYRLPSADRRWITRTIVFIVFVGHTGHGECGSGDTYAGKGKDCVGVGQFRGRWDHHPGKGIVPGHHHHDWRLCYRCSVWRMVKVYKVGGAAKIRQHWKATVPCR